MTTHPRVVAGIQIVSQATSFDAQNNFTAAIPLYKQALVEFYLALAGGFLFIALFLSFFLSFFLSLSTI